MRFEPSTYRCLITMVSDSQFKNQSFLLPVWQINFSSSVTCKIRDDFIIRTFNSRSSQCSTTGVTKVVVCVILYVG